jgi:ABC-type sugar transport system ATPase subunit
MAVLEAIDMQKRFGAVTALDGLDLEVQEGEVLALLGPTGAGKTTTLRALSGLVTLDKGVVKLDGETITDDSPRARDLAVVFEGFNLLPTLSVYDNIAFPLRSPVYKESEEAVNVQVHRASEDLKISHLLDRQIDQLSGGEKQRVAVARALVRHPRVYLLDEPLSALDLKLRESLQDELKQMHTKNGSTVVYASHDFPSAADLATRIALIDAGRVIQIGTLAELIANPCHTQVGRLIGSPSMSLFAGHLQEGNFHSCDSLWSATLCDSGAVADGDVTLGIWPEDISLSTEAKPGYPEGTVYATDFRGRDRAIEVHSGAHRFRKAIDRKLPLNEGAKVWFQLAAQHCFVFHRTTGERLMIPTTTQLSGTNG